VIFGVARDDAGQTIEGMVVKAYPLFAPASGPTVTETDSQGSYSMDICVGTTYGMFAEVIAGSRWMQNDQWDTVEATESVQYDIDVTRGDFLEATLQEPPVIAQPGAPVELTIDYRAWSAESAANFRYEILVGFEGEFAGDAELGRGNYEQTEGGSIGTVVISTVAPTTSGTHGIYGRFFKGVHESEWVYQSTFPTNKERLFIELGTLTVDH